MSSLLYFLGQDVGITTDAMGDETPVVTVTDPAGQVSTPSVTSTGSGTYAAVVPAVSVPGVWLYRWVSAGDVDEGQFQVRPAGVEQLVDIASVRAHLNMPDESQDAELQGFILAAADIARDVIGPVLAETHTQYFSGGVSTIVPDWLPITSILSVTEYYGLSAYPLTEQDLGSQSTTFSFTADYATGQITRRTFGGEAARFAYGTKNIKVVYIAGRTDVPYTVRLGALELIRHLWQVSQQGLRPRLGASGLDMDTSAVPVGFAVPQRVLELWAPYRRAPGVA